MFQDQKVRLILGDVDAIKAFVYESNALPDIRGGSEILVELEGKVQSLLGKRIGEGELVYCGGGGFLAIVPEKEAEGLKEEIERLYLERTKIATITVVYSEAIDRSELEKGVPPRDEKTLYELKGKGVSCDLIFSHYDAAFKGKDRLNRKNFGEWVSWLVIKLQQAKRQKAYFPFFPSLPVHERCQACGKRATSKEDNVTGEKICSVCWQKREIGRERRRTFVEEFVRWTGEEITDVKKRIPKDLDTLAGENGKIAFLYADGNNMGDLLQRMRTPEEYRQLSKSISEATKEALFKAIWETFGKEQLTQTLPFEIIALGGDDVVVIVPSRYGWGLALRFLEAFEQHKLVQNLNRESEWNLTMSAGLVIADVKYPIRFMMELTEGLLKQAKSLAREKQESTICHLWLRAPIVSEDAKSILTALYYRKRSRQERWLTARPFTLQQAKSLSETAEKLKGLPSSQRRNLAEAVDKGVKTSINLALYQVAKRREESSQLLEVLKKLGQLVGDEIKDEGMFFWRCKNATWQTALLDALELIDLDAV